MCHVLSLKKRRFEFCVVIWAPHLPDHQWVLPDEDPYFSPSEGDSYVFLSLKKKKKKILKLCTKMLVLRKQWSLVSTSRRKLTNFWGLKEFWKDNVNCTYNKQLLYHSSLSAIRSCINMFASVPAQPFYFPNCWGALGFSMMSGRGKRKRVFWVSWSLLILINEAVNLAVWNCYFWRKTIKIPLKWLKLWRCSWLKTHKRISLSLYML